MVVTASVSAALASFVFVCILASSLESSVDARISSPLTGLRQRLYGQRFPSLSDGNDTRATDRPSSNSTNGDVSTLFGGVTLNDALLLAAIGLLILLILAYMAFQRFRAQRRLAEQQAAQQRQALDFLHAQTRPPPIQPSL
jgi:hypothetical protein